MRLPKAFIDEMIQLWSEYEPAGSLSNFLEAHDQTSASGIRTNLLKLTPDELKAMLPDLVKELVPWTKSGFYTDDSASPGKLPQYHAGLFYIQEPSAMLPAEVLAVQPGDKVLDLCAAPGGKSTRLAAAVGTQGLLWANEINGERAKALLRNLELAGSDRTMITQDTPGRLAERLPDYFDRILVDAPCSGSGMFRRDPQATDSWERYGPATCTPVQAEILEAADRMLKPGGYLVYSTCSFSIAEDEAMIENFVLKHPQYRVEKIPLISGISQGLPLAVDLEKTARIWPHLTQGDGHYCALLYKRPQTGQSDRSSTPQKKLEAGIREESAAIACFMEWARLTLSETGMNKLKQREQFAYYRFHQDRLHLVPDSVRSLESLHWIKTGLFLGYTHVKNKSHPRKAASRQPGVPSGNLLVFEPAHAMALTLEADDFRYALSLDASDPLLLKYLRGETIEWPESLWPADGWPQGAYLAVCLDRFPLGWARAQNRGQLKNLYPPGWRKLS